MLNQTTSEDYHWTGRRRGSSLYIWEGFLPPLRQRPFKHIRVRTPFTPSDQGILDTVGPGVPPRGPWGDLLGLGKGELVDKAHSHHGHSRTQAVKRNGQS